MKKAQGPAIYAPKIRCMYHM